MNTPLTAGLADINPDADLIRICDGHAALMDAVNLSDDEDDTYYGPVWDAYRHSAQTISASEPRTVAGMLAIARAAKAEAHVPNQKECGDDGYAAAWSWIVLNGLLRIENGMTIP